MPQQAEGDIDGRIDAFQFPRVIKGWAMSRGDPTRTLNVVSMSDTGEEIGRSEVNLIREDLRSVGGLNSGFMLNLERDISFSDIHNKKVIFYAISSDIPSSIIPVGASLTAQASAGYALEMLSTHMKKHGMDHLNRFMRDAARLTTKPEIIKILDSLVLGESQKNAITANSKAAIPNPDSLSPLYFPIGTVSSDQSSVLGHAGKVFILKGGNELDAMYDASPTEADPVVRRWKDLIEARSRALRLVDTSYLQVIIPDKQSVYPSMYHREIEAPTPFLKGIESALRLGETGGSFYLSALDVFTKSQKLGVYRDVDSHTTPYGAYQIFSAIMERVGYKIADPPIFDQPKITTPDMGSRYFSVPFYDPYLQSTESVISSRTALVSSHKNEGTNIGSTYVWRNETALFDLKVVAFGNSYFSIGKHQGELSWWFSRYVKEFHFIWTPEFDEEYDDVSDADLVICQTVERFLRSVPSK